MADQIRQGIEDDIVAEQLIVDRGAVSSQVRQVIDERLECFPVTAIKPGSWTFPRVFEMLVV